MATAMGEMPAEPLVLQLQLAWPLLLPKLAASTRAGVQQPSAVVVVCTASVRDGMTDACIVAAAKAQLVQVIPHFT